jgi:hypothetical protein
MYKKIGSYGLTFFFYSTAFFIPFTEISLHATHDASDIMEVEGLLASVPPVVSSSNSHPSPAVVSLSTTVAQTSIPHSSETMPGLSGDAVLQIPQMSDISYLAPTCTLQEVLKSNDVTNSIVISTSDLLCSNEEKRTMHIASAELDGRILRNTTVIPNIIDSSEQIHGSHPIFTNEEVLPSSHATSFDIFDDPDTRGLESGKQITDILRLLSASGQIQSIQLTESVSNETNPSSSNVFEASGVRAAEILSFLSASGQIQDIQLASSVETGNVSENLSGTAGKTSGNILYLTSPSLSTANLPDDLTSFISSSTVDPNPIENAPKVIEMKNSRIVLHVQDAALILDPDKDQEDLNNTVNVVFPSISVPSTTTACSPKLSSWISGIDCSPSSNHADGTSPLGKDYEENNWSSCPHNDHMKQQSDLNVVTPTSHVLFTALNVKDPHSYEKAGEMRDVLKDITKDADICKCNPCRCDPSHQECEMCNAGTGTESVSAIPEVSSDNSTIRKREKNDTSHTKLEASQVNTESSGNDVCKTAEIGSQCSASFGSCEHTRMIIGSSTNEPVAHETVSVGAESSHYATHDLNRVTDITLTESTGSTQTNHSHDANNLGSWQNPGCSVDTLIVPHILPPDELQEHCESGSSQNNNVEMDSSRLSSSCDCCGKNTEKTPHCEVESNNNGTSSREPCCIVVCLKTLEQLRKLIDKSCCSGAENSIRALALQVASAKPSCCSGKHK